MAERTGERSGQRDTRRSGGGRDQEPHRRGGRFGNRGLAQQQHGPAGDLRPPVQPPGRRQVQPGGIAAHLDQHQRQRVETGGLFGHPQRIGEPGRRAEEKIVLVEPGQPGEAGRMREAGFGEGRSGADPQHRPRLAALPAPLAQPAGKRERKAARCARVARREAVDLGQRRHGQAAAQRPVETFGAGGETGLRNLLRPCIEDRHGVAAQHRPGIRRYGCVQALRRPALDLRDCPAQGQNGFPRHGGCRHVGLSRSLFLLCSYGFQSPA